MATPDGSAEFWTGQSGFLDCTFVRKFVRNRGVYTQLCALKSWTSHRDYELPVIGLLFSVHQKRYFLLSRSPGPLSASRYVTSFDWLCESTMTINLILTTSPFNWQVQICIKQSAKELTGHVGFYFFVFSLIRCEPQVLECVHICFLINDLAKEVQILVAHAGDLFNERLLK